MLKVCWLSIWSCLTCLIWLLCILACDPSSIWVTSMQWGTNPAKNRGYIWPKTSKKLLKWGQEWLSTHATLLSQKAREQNNEGRGVSLPYARPLTILFNTEKPLVFGGEKANTLKQTKPYQRGNKRDQIRPRRFSLHLNHNTILMKVL